MKYYNTENFQNVWPGRKFASLGIDSDLAAIGAGCLLLA